MRDQGVESRSSGCLASDDDEVCAAPEHRGLRLERACDPQDDLTSRRIVPAFEKIGENPGRAFDAIEAFDVEAGGSPAIRTDNLKTLNVD